MLPLIPENVQAIHRHDTAARPTPVDQEADGASTDLWDGWTTAKKTQEACAMITDSDDDEDDELDLGEMGL